VPAALKVRVHQYLTLQRHDGAFPGELQWYRYKGGFIVYAI